METNPVGQDLGLPAKQPRVAKKTLDKNDFLSLLVGQLKNQDPLEPQSNEEFMSTMAQFNSLETLISVDKNLQYSQAMALIGKPVTVQLPNKDPLSGRVEKAAVVDGEVVVYVGGEKYNLSDIRETLHQDPAQKPATGSDLIQAALMIGREVLISSGDGQVRGKVEKVALESGVVKVYVNGLPYDIAGISEIRDPGQGAAQESSQKQDASGVVDGEGTERGNG